MGKSFSTLVTTTLQYVSACRRGHSFTETVYFASLSFFGLVRSLHNFLLLLILFVFLRFSF